MFNAFRLFSSIFRFLSILENSKRSLLSFEQQTNETYCEKEMMSFEILKFIKTSWHKRFLLLLCASSFNKHFKQKKLKVYENESLFFFVS